MMRRGEIVLGDKRLMRRLSGRFRRRVTRVLLAGGALIYIAWSVESADESTREKQALVDISRIEHVTRLFRADQGRCPDDIEELVSAQWDERYSVNTIDPWGQPYRIQCPRASDPGGVMVLSGGPDREITGEDDITSL